MEVPKGREKNEKTRGPEIVEVPEGREKNKKTH